MLNITKPPVVDDDDYDDYDDDDDDDDDSLLVSVVSISRLFSLHMSTLLKD